MQQRGVYSAAAQGSGKIDRAQFGGVPSNAFFIPVVTVLAILNIVVMMLMFSIFTQSGKLAQTMQESNTYITDATSLLAATSLLSETSSNYVLMPITAQGESNVGPLIAYANEMKESDHRADSVLSRFETYQVSEEAHENVRTAAQSANTLLDMQSHAIALVDSAYPLPDIPALEGLELPELSAEEAALPNDEKVRLAQSIVLGSDWGSNKSSVSNNVNAAVGNMRATFGQQAATTSASIAFLRTLIIVVSCLIIISLIVVFISLYRLIVAPLGNFSELIVNGEVLDENRGLREIRLLAGSHNKLLHRREALEEVLREAAETDTLTGLPNRYSMQQYILEADEDKRSITVFLFDVDHLKFTNDTYGHAAGDKLIRRASQCIATCFASTDDGRCYRMAGDEFAAVIRNLDQSEIPALSEAFEEMQEHNSVSISWGYAYSPDNSTSFKSLLEEADRRMYVMKEEVHHNGKHSRPQI